VQYERCSFDRDVEHCPNCGGAPKIIAAIGEPAVISRILTHLGLPARAPARPGAAAGLIQAGVILATTIVLPPKPAPRLGLRLRELPQRP